MSAVHRGIHDAIMTSLFFIYVQSCIGIKRHECTTCGKRLCSKSSLRKHERVMHTTKPEVDKDPKVFEYCILILAGIANSIFVHFINYVLILVANKTKLFHGCKYQTDLFCCNLFRSI